MKIHIVKKGDTLYELSQKYNVPLEKLIEANPQIANPDQLTLGEKVKIPAGAVQVEGEGYKHVAKQGDTLWKLSKAWGIPLQTLINANPQISDPNVLKAGDIVLIPVKGGGTANPSGHSGEGKVPGTGGKKNTAPKPTPAPAPAPAPKPETKPETKPEQKPNPPKEEMTKPKPTPPAPKPNPNPPMPAPNPPAPNPNPPMPKPISPIENSNPPMPAPNPMPPIKLEFVEQIQFQSVKSEEPLCKPVPECPEPWSSSPYYSVDPYGGGMQMYPSSTHGCDDHKMHHKSHQISSFYDFPQLPNQGPSMMGPMMENEAMTGGYPGLGQDWMQQGNNMMGNMMGMGWMPSGQPDNQPWVQGQSGWGGPTPNSDNNVAPIAPNSPFPGLSPEQCGPGHGPGYGPAPGPWPMHSCGCHYRYPYGYEYPVAPFDPAFQANPANYAPNQYYGAPVVQQPQYYAPVGPVTFEGGFGTFNEFGGAREQQAGFASEQGRVAEEDVAEKPQAKSKTTAKKEVKISGSQSGSVSRKGSGKRSSSKSGSTSQKSRKSSTRRNPWG